MHSGSARLAIQKSLLNKTGATIVERKASRSTHIEIQQDLLALVARVVEHIYLHVSRVHATQGQR